MASCRFIACVVVFLATIARAQTITPRDIRDDVLYEIMPIAWRTHADDPSREGSFRGLIESLDYLDTLGITGTWLTPIFPSPAYHGYQHAEADRVNPRLGTEDEFLRFVAASHDRQMKVLIDLVTYGINAESAIAKAAQAQPQDNPWLAAGTGHEAVHNGYSYRTWNGGRVSFLRWDLRHPEPRNLVIGWASHWLDPNADGDLRDGVDGFRLDQVWPVYPHGPDGWGYSNALFWDVWDQQLHRLKPDLFCVAEQARWETFGDNLLEHHDAALTKPFLFAARKALREERASALYEAMRATLDAIRPHQDQGRTFLCTLGDHDVDRLASAIGADTPETTGRARAAAAVLLLQPFPPVIYYGDEIGMLGREAHYGGDANDLHRREPMKWLAKAGPPMSNYTIHHERAHAALASRDHDGRSVEEQSGVAGSLLEAYRELIRLRRATPALRRGDYLPIPARHPSLWCFERRTPDQRVVVVINLGGQEADWASPGGPLVRLEPYGYRVILLED